MNTTPHTPFITYADALAGTNVASIDAACAALPRPSIVWEV